MSILLVCLGIMVFVTTPTAVALYTCIGVRCCVHPISIKGWLNYTHLWVIINKDANSTSAADDITNLIICTTVRTDPSKAGIGIFLERHA